MAQKNIAEVSSRVDVDDLERGVLAYWEQADIFGQSLNKNRNGERYVFYDGPPYATGKPHYGHLLQSAIKDSVLRFKTMQGYYVPRRVGWDCHGLPVETIVEKELGFNSKKEIEEYGIEKFNQRCRDTVTRYIDEFTATLKRMGRWASYDEPYFTMDRDYMEKEWGVFKQLWDKELVYPAFRSTPYCVRCETPLSNFEVSMAYKDKVDTAIYVALRASAKGKVKSEKQIGIQQGASLYLLVWTTTPWTLPGNAAVAFNPNMEYVSVKHEGRELIVAKKLVKKLFGEAVKEGKLWSNEELRGIRYEPLYDPLAPARAGALPLSKGEKKNLYGLIESDHVTGEDGTGLVHIAPAFGEEDAELGKRYQLPVLRTVTLDGKFMPEVKGFAGEHIFEASEKIVADLKGKKALFKEEQYKHSYPFCWRCDTPLIYYALDSWFVRVGDLKEKMLELNEKEINWIPAHVKKGRFGKGIESAPDWAVSRNRYWSVPIPIWQCDVCKTQVCVGSSRELWERSNLEQIEDLHRPYVDEIVWPCDKCEGKMERVPEVLDVWFDSGSMPYTQEQFPADFIAESIEQTRAWFYTLHVLATALKKKSAFKNALASGLIFAEDGQKLSKKLKNYPEPEPTIAKYGADMLRFYLLASTTFGEPYRFSEKELTQLSRNFYQTMWNVYSFFTRYANVHEWRPGQGQGAERGLLDRWVLAHLKSAEKYMLELMQAYRFDQAAREAISLVDNLSNWYVRRSRQRFQAGDMAAFAVLHEVLVRISKLLAPLAPFVTDEMYRNLTGKVSVHLEDLPPDPKKLPGITEEQEELVDTMRRVREVVSEALALRARAGLKVRQPLAELVVQGDKLGEDFRGIVCEEVNVKEISFTRELPRQSSGEDYVYSREDSKVLVALNTELTEELKSEGIAREIIRHGQVIRRGADLALNDRIILSFSSEDEGVTRAFDRHKDIIMKALQADEVLEDAGGTEVKINNQPVYLGVARI